MPEILYLDTPDALQQFAGRIASRPWLAVDTEFIRERTYYPQLCLLQISDGVETACIDPLALKDLSPLFRVLQDPRITKVFHAASQDMELLFHLTGEVPAPIFDTQVAASLAGFGDQAGYARLVQELLGVELDKAHTRSDWGRRPLSAAEISYAADDVIYLCLIYQRLHDELQRRGRLDWLEEDFADLSDPARYRNPPEDAWERIGGANKLRAGQQAILRGVAAWREEQARKHDRPRKWILADDVLLDLARRQPSTVEDLGRMRGLPEGMAQKHGPSLLAAIQAAGSAPTRPALLEPRRLPIEQQPLVELLMGQLHAIAQDQAISQAALAGRRELEQLVLGERDLPILRGWRLKAAGEALLELLEGHSTLGVENGRVVTRKK